MIGYYLKKLIRNILSLNKNRLISFLLILFLLHYPPGIVNPKERTADTRIVILMDGNIPEYNECVSGFEETLRNAGVKYEIILKEVFDRELSSQDLNLISGIIRSNPDLIFTVGRRSILSILEIDDIPVIFSMVLNTDFLNSEPDNREKHKNKTGVTLRVPADDQIRLCKRIVPGLKQIGVLYTPSENKDYIEEAKQAGKRFNVELIDADIKSTREVTRTLENIIEFIDVYWLLTDNSVLQTKAIEYIIKETYNNNIPVMAPSERFVDAGAAFSIRADYFAVGIQSGEMLLKLMDSAPISDISIEPPGQFKIFINKQIVDDIGLKIPEEILKNAVLISK